MSPLFGILFVNSSDEQLYVVRVCILLAIGTVFGSFLTFSQSVARMEVCETLDARFEGAGLATLEEYGCNSGPLDGAREIRRFEDEVFEDRAFENKDRAVEDKDGAFKGRACEDKDGAFKDRACEDKDGAFKDRDEFNVEDEVDVFKDRAFKDGAFEEVAFNDGEGWFSADWVRVHSNLFMNLPFPVLGILSKSTSIEKFALKICQFPYSNVKLDLQWIWVLNVLNMLEVFSWAIHLRKIGLNNLHLSCLQLNPSPSHHIHLFDIVSPLEKIVKYLV